MNELLIRFRRGSAREALADAGVPLRDGSPASAPRRPRALQRALRQGRRRAAGAGASARAHDHPQPRSARAGELAEETLDAQVDAAADDLGRLNLQADHVEEGDPGLGRELDQYVHVAPRAEILAQHGAEEGEAPDGIAAAEVGDALVIDLDVQAHAALSVGDGL